MFWGGFGSYAEAWLCARVRDPSIPGEGVLRLRVRVCSLYLPRERVMLRMLMWVGHRKGLV